MNEARNVYMEFSFLWLDMLCMHSHTIVHTEKMVFALLRPQQH